MKQKIQELVNETLSDAQCGDVDGNVLLDLIDSGQSEGGSQACHCHKAI